MWVVLWPLSQKPWFWQTTTKCSLGSWTCSTHTKCCWLHSTFYGLWPYLHWQYTQRRSACIYNHETTIRLELAVAVLATPWLSLYDNKLRKIKTTLRVLLEVRCSLLCLTAIFKGTSLVMIQCLLQLHCSIWFSSTILSTRRNSRLQIIGHPVKMAEQNEARRYTTVKKLLDRATLN